MRNILAYTLLAISGVVLAPPGLAKETPEEPAVDPKAIAALDAMAAHLRTLQEFELTATTTIDDVGAAAAVTAAAVGSYSLPGGCVTIYYSDVACRECGGVWYAPRYQGSQVVYVVVNQP